MQDFECYEAFKNQCTCDKNSVKELYKRCRTSVLACGRNLIEKQVRWAYTIPRDSSAGPYLEFLEFLDGNGFIIKQVQPHTYHIIPQYPETTEFEMLPF